MTSRALFPPMSYLPTLLGALCVAVMVAADARHYGHARAAAKVLASLCFVAQATINGAYVTVAGLAVTGGLLFSLGGDILLIWRDKRPFAAGIAAFLLAHIVYIGAFVYLGVAPVASIVALAVLGAGTGLLASRFVPKAGSLAPAVVAYIVVITLMGAAAVGALAHTPTWSRFALAAAALSFMASDVCVARDRFEGTGFANRASGWVMYYTAQFVFTWAIASA
jgi:uncharacterized membrane protein YhhN